MRVTPPLVVALAILAACSSDYAGADSAGASDGGDGDSGGGNDGPPDAIDGGDAAPVACATCVVLAEQQDMPTELILVGTQLFWVNVGSNVSIPMTLHLDTGALEKSETYGPGMHDLQWVAPNPWAIDKTLALNRFFPSYVCDSIGGAKRLTAFDTDFVWVEATGLRRGNCSGFDFTLIANKTDLQAVVADTTRVWFSDAAGAIASCDPSGTSQCEMSSTALATAQGSVTVMAIDETRVYWATPAPSSTVRSRAKLAVTSAPPVDIATGQGDVKVIVPRGSDVFWTDADRGTVMKASSSGGMTVTTIASGIDRPWGLAVGPSDVYVAESGRGRILRIPR